MNQAEDTQGSRYIKMKDKNRKQKEICKRRFTSDSDEAGY